MTLETLKSSLPEYAKDLRLNLDSVLGEGGAPGLDGKQIRAVALAAAIVSRYAPLTRAIEAFASEQLDAGECDGVRAAAAIMGMSNIYYRFTHLVGNDEYQTLRAGLRMNVLARPGVDKVAFEAACLAASAVNGCGACLASHEKVLRQHGMSAQGVQSIARIAAVIHAVAVTVEQAAAA
ncbi:MAG: carboxymuconolactone decarboxylase family protein [Proteobacteria bacterium]|nr:carboxymuconolactone decarboxylase family protein [Pseudomonadota bacterium]MBS0461250.1 carboxymuconolactone decarboxylase family protein [Pseudomonadota bacterium]MBS0465084.1 carboxymuconolactone decarboxylase family protein [Pseudomonadota bacterium]